MDEELEDSEFYLLSQKAARQSCFGCKSRIDSNPSGKFFLEILLGTLLVLHFWASFSMFLCSFLGFGKIRYSHAVLPLVFLVLEVLAACFVVLCLIFQDLCTKKVKGITLWQRQAIGRLSRNLFFYIFVEWSLFMIYLRVDQKNFRIFPCLFPLIFLNFITIFRYLLIKSDYSLFWICSSVSFFAELVLIVLKFDYFHKMNWEIVLIPFYVQSFLVLIVSIYNLYIFRDDCYNLTLAILACSGFCLIICGVGLYLTLDLYSYSAVLTVSGSALGSLGVIHVFGSFMIEILIGHIDSDVSEFKNSIQNVPNVPHSV